MKAPQAKKIFYTTSAGLPAGTIFRLPPRARRRRENFLDYLRESLGEAKNFYTTSAASRGTTPFIFSWVHGSTGPRIRGQEPRCLFLNNIEDPFSHRLFRELKKKTSDKKTIGKIWRRLFFNLVARQTHLNMSSHGFIASCIATVIKCILDICRPLRRVAIFFILSTINHHHSSNLAAPRAFEFSFNSFKEHCTR